MQVLIVDDNVMDRKYIKYLLENNLQLSTKTAKDGLDAINKLKETHFDLVITDIVMPNIDGIELVQYIKSKYPLTDIIAVTGNNPYYLQIVNKLGVNQIFAKPVDNSRLINLVDKLLKKHTNSAYA